LKQKKVERLRQKRLEEAERTQGEENKHRQLIQLKKSAEEIRRRSSLRDVNSPQSCLGLSNSIKDLQVSTEGMDESKHPLRPSALQNGDELNPVVSYQAVKSNARETSDVKSLQMKRLSAKQRWQVSPLIQLLSRQLERKGCNLKEWFTYDDLFQKNEYSMIEPFKRPSLPGIVHNVVNTFVQNPNFQNASRCVEYPPWLENRTRVSAIIASHILENAIPLGRYDETTISNHIEEEDRSANVAIQSTVKSIASSDEYE